MIPVSRRMRVVSALLGMSSLSAIPHLGFSNMFGSHIKGKASHKIVSDGEALLSPKFASLAKPTNTLQRVISSAT